MRSIVQRRWLLMGVLLLILGALSPFVAKAAKPDNSLTVWFLETDPKLDAYHEFQKTFGNDEIIVMQVHQSEGVFTPPVVKKLRDAKTRFEQIDGVARAYSVLDVQRLVRKAPKKTLGGFSLPGALQQPTLDAQPLIPKQAGASALKLAKQHAMSMPTVKGVLVNEDATRATILIQMKVMGDIDEKRNQIVDQIRQDADAVFGKTPHPMGGIGVIYAGLNEITTHDFGLFVSLGYLIMFVMLWVVFRSLRLVLASLGVILVGTWISLGVYGAMGHRLNTMTVVLPTLIIVLGIADAVHFPVAFLRARGTRAEGESDMAVAARGLKDAFVPCALTTLTTAAGFLALVSSPMGVVRELGIYSAIGIVAALFAAVLLMGVAFMGLAGAHSLPELPKIKSGLGMVQRQLQTHPGRWAGVIALFVALGAWGASAVKIDTYTLGAFPKDHIVVQDHQSIERGWGPYSTLEFLVKPRAGRVDDPEMLKSLEAFAKQAKAQPKVGQVIHVGQLYRYGAQTLDPSLKPDAPLPETTIKAFQALSERESLSWAHDDPKTLDNPVASVMTKDGRVGRVTMTVKMVSARELDEVLKTMAALSQTHFGDRAQVIPAGYPPLYVSIIDYVMESQVRGFFIALGLIFIIMLIWLRSLRLALISLLPNVFPVLMMMGVMGALSIDLDIATATVAAIVIGVAIDDTVHFLHAWKSAEDQNQSWEACLNHTFEHAGRAAVITTILLVTGFPVLMLADVATVFDFGLLTTVAALAALLADLILLPLLLRIWPAKST